MNKATTRKTLKKIILLTIISLGILLLIGIANTGTMDNLEKAKQATTKAGLANLHDAVSVFKQDTGRYPSPENGLRELIEKPADVISWPPGGYLVQTSVPLDGWKNEFVYVISSDPNKPFDIISYGADGKPGGTGYDTDIHSTDLEGSSK